MSEAAATDAFNEDYYCAAYSDVGKAVARGFFSSGCEHFERHGRNERRFSSAQFEASLLSLSDAERQARVSEVWSQDTDKNLGWYWMAYPAVRTRLNHLAAGHPDHDTYDRLAALLRERGDAVPIGRAVSFGGLEGDLARRGTIAEMDAYNIAPDAIAKAWRLADEAGLSGLRYYAADLEHVEFAPGTVDVVFAHHSVHHVERLDGLSAPCCGRAACFICMSSWVRRDSSGPTPRSSW